MTALQSATARYEAAAAEFKAAADALHRITPTGATGTSLRAIHAIRDIVAEYHDIPLSTFLSKARPEPVATARMVAIYLARKLTRAGVEEIGAAFNRHHTTVTHAEQAIAARCETDRFFNREVELLRYAAERALLALLALPAA